MLVVHHLLIHVQISLFYMINLSEVPHEKLLISIELFKGCVIGTRENTQSKQKYVLLIPTNSFHLIEDFRLVRKMLKDYCEIHFQF